MSRQPLVYQIDFSAVASGKRIASTKRRVRWRFGFANMAALSNGEVGTACRGEEHDITLIWSINSGKRHVLLDGQEAHFSTNRAAFFDHSWTMRGGHVVKIIAYASPPMNPAPGFRQYELFINGQSFYSFPRVYRLGMAANDPRAVPNGQSMDRLAHHSPRRSRDPSSSGIASLEAPHNPDEEEAYLQEAIRQSLNDAQPPASAPAASSGDLLDFGGSPAPPPQQPASNPYAPNPSYGAPLALPPSTSFDPSTTSASDPWSTQPAYATAPAPALPPSTTPQPNGYGSPYAAPPAVTAANPFAPQPAAAANPFEAAAPVSQQAPAPSWQAPPPISTQLANDAVPPTFTPQAATTPSTLGFASPQPNFAGFSPQPPVQQQQPQHQYQAPFAPEPSPYAPAPVPAQAPYAPEPAPPASSFSPEPAPFAPEPTQPAPPAAAPVGLTMNQLSSNEGLINSGASASGSLVDQAYAKLASMDTFTLSSNKDEVAANPFEMSSTSIADTRSLADMQKGKSAPKKEIMKSNAVIVSNNQNSYASQYGLQPTAQPQPPFGQQPTYGQPPAPQYGQPPAPPQYGQPNGQVAQPYGQQPQSMPTGQAYAPSTAQNGQGPYGQAPNTQAPQYGQPPAAPGGQLPQYANPYAPQQQYDQPQAPYGQQAGFRY